MDNNQAAYEELSELKEMHWAFIRLYLNPDNSHIDHVRKMAMDALEAVYSQGRSDGYEDGLSHGYSNGIAQR